MVPAHQDFAKTLDAITGPKVAWLHDLTRTLDTFAAPKLAQVSEISKTFDAVTAPKLGQVHEFSKAFDAMTAPRLGQVHEFSKALDAVTAPKLGRVCEISKAFEATTAPKLGRVCEISKAFDAMTAPKLGQVREFSKAFDAMTAPKLGRVSEISKAFDAMTAPKLALGVGLADALVASAGTRQLNNVAWRQYLSDTLPVAQYVEPMAAEAMQAYRDEPERVSASIDPMQAQMLAFMEQMVEQTTRIAANTAPLTTAVLYRKRLLTVLAWVIAYIGVEHAEELFAAVLDAVR